MPKALPANYHLTWNQLQIPFSKVVPISGDEVSKREGYVDFVKKEILRRSASILKAQTWMK